MTTAADISDALHRRYNRPSQGRDGEQWICIEEARAGAGFKGNDGRCDFLAINTWQSRGMELIGHEIKVSMSDWRTELAKPAKADRFSRYCRRWWVAAPSDLAKRIKEEVPDTWGLLAVSDKGVARELRPAPATKPEPVPTWWWVGWLAHIDRHWKRQFPNEIDRRIADERTRLRERLNADVEHRVETRLLEFENLRNNVAALREATGIDLSTAYSGDFRRLGLAWQAQRSSVDLNGLADHLRRGVEALEAFAAMSEPVASRG